MGINYYHYTAYIRVRSLCLRLEGPRCETSFETIHNYKTLQSNDGRSVNCSMYRFVKVLSSQFAVSVKEINY